MGTKASRGRVAVRASGLAVGGAALITLLSGCLQEVGEVFDGFGWPQGGITDQSQRMYDMWIGSVLAALLVGFLVWGLIFWCLIRYRKRSDELPTQTRFNLPMEVLYTITPFLVIAVLFYHTVVIQDEVEATTPDPDVTVEVVAFKWNWQFNYRDEPGEEANTIASTVGTSDQIPILVVPTGQTIRFELTAEDVIHSFWVPELLFKRDVFPGLVRNEFEVTIQVDREGHYVGRCAEFCGTYHSMMNFELRAVSPEVYQDYLGALQAGLSQPEALQSVGEAPLATTTEPFDTRRTFDGEDPQGASELSGVPELPADAESEGVR
ncbi:cytochrome c oxidase subunit II [Natronosporangium hydrolyticum]|uniref:Cytochrome c oxidase subunit 2 n=1 Tax=Natronosporangium hydrolyticum TaxID=2811111 RepID=A0A895YG61_9ACTN|nr:cytochrome c oxidase subunit II [Natronosporangium hydrolyticum]QSB13526.1 cytochrome c oxidase subunit II [Natronosporangium hydrolyticum]